LIRNGSRERLQDAKSPRVVRIMGRPASRPKDESCTADVTMRVQRRDCGVTEPAAMWTFQRLKFSVL
jgi:hypothetical protein